MSSRMFHRLSQLVGPLSIGLLLFFTIRQYWFAYFWFDDINNLSLIMPFSAANMFDFALNPTARFFRPAGLAWYWLMLQLFGLNAMPYHILAWSLHALNTFLVYLILKRIAGSREGAFVGAMLFASQTVFGEIYWSFGTIFELVCGLLFFVAILTWANDRWGWVAVLVVSMLFYVALRTKEMAITLPAVLLSYDLLFRRDLKWKSIARVLLPGFVGLWYAWMNWSEIAPTADPAYPYYINLTGLTMGRSYGGYFGMLFGTSFRWQFWCIGFVALLLVFAILKKYKAIFFQSYLFITLLPVIFIVNHQYGFYWYIPLVGVCGLAALATGGIVGWLGPRIPDHWARAIAAVVFPLLCWATYVRQSNGTENVRGWERDLAIEHRAFISGLQALPAPPANETIFFASIPRYYDAVSMVSAVRVVFNQHDVDVQLVKGCPAEARYCVRFEDSRVTLSGK